MTALKSLGHEAYFDICWYLLLNRPCREDYKNSTWSILGWRSAANAELLSATQCILEELSIQEQIIQPDGIDSLPGSRSRARITFYDHVGDQRDWGSAGQSTPNPAACASCKQGVVVMVTQWSRLTTVELGLCNVMTKATPQHNVLQGFYWVPSVIIAFPSYLYMIILRKLGCNTDLPRCWGKRSPDVPDAWQMLYKDDSVRV